MTKIIPMLCLSLAVSTACHANHKHASPKTRFKVQNAHHHVFMGAQAGIINGHYRNNAASTGDIHGNDTLIFSNRFIEQSTSPQFGVHLGIEFIKKHFYLAAVVAANYTHQQYLGEAKTQYVPSPTLNLENSTLVRVHGLVFEAAIHPGFAFRDNTTGYGIVGVDSAKFTLESKTNFSFRQGNNIDMGALNMGQQKRSTGIKLGVGLRTQVMKGLNVYAEYAFHRYSSLSLSGIAPTFGAQTGDVVTNTTTVRPRHHSIMMGIDYELLA